MPPDVPHCPRLVTRSVQVSPESKLNILPGGNHCRATKGMNVTVRKLIPVLVFFLSSVSIIRFIRIPISTTSSPIGNKAMLSYHETSATMLTEKEFKFLSKVVSSRVPCNLLVFGFEPEYPVISSINAGGRTVFLEDNPYKISRIKASSNTSRVWKIEHKTPAREAYELLQEARRNPSCRPGLGLIKESTCRLLMTNLPKEVYGRKWDVVLVDGPSGDKPELPGRMAAIYTAGILARAGGTTNVVVHDVDRTIEKWFSWEFLCDENLVSSKGRFWNFRISGQQNSTRFCSDITTGIE